MRRVGLLGFAVVLLAAATACGGGDKGQSAGGSARSGGEKTSYTIKEFVFKPLSAKAGGTIEVTNMDTEGHTITADNKAFDWKIDAKGEGSFTAPSAGTYPFSCTNHPTMKGTLTVNE